MWAVHLQARAFSQGDMPTKNHLTPAWTDMMYALKHNQPVVNNAVPLELYQPNNDNNNPNSRGKHQLGGGGNNTNNNNNNNNDNLDGKSLDLKSSTTKTTTQRSKLLWPSFLHQMADSQEWRKFAQKQMWNQTSYSLTETTCVWNQLYLDLVSLAATDHIPKCWIQKQIKH